MTRVPSRNASGSPRDADLRRAPDRKAVVRWFPAGDPRLVPFAGAAGTIVSRAALRGCTLLCLVALAACRHDVPRPVTASDAATLRPLTRVTEYVGLSGAAVSPDGRFLVHTDWTTGDLTVRDLRTDESRHITNNGPLSRSVEFAEFFMRFSPDGRRLAYIWDRNGYELHVTDLGDAASSRFIYRNPPEQGEVLAYDWSDDGAYVAAVVPAGSDGGRLGIALIAVADGSVIGLRDLDGATGALMWDARMSFSPDSRFLAYELPEAGSKRWQIFVRDLQERSAATDRDRSSGASRDPLPSRRATDRVRLRTAGVRDLGARGASPATVSRRVGASEAG